MFVVSIFSRTAFSGRCSTFAKEIYRHLDVIIKDSSCLYVSAFMLAVNWT